MKANVIILGDAATFTGLAAGRPHYQRRVEPGSQSEAFSLSFPLQSKGTFLIEVGICTKDCKRSVVVFCEKIKCVFITRFALRGHDGEAVVGQLCFIFSCRHHNKIESAEVIFAATCKDVRARPSGRVEIHSLSTRNLKTTKEAVIFDP